MDDSNFRTVVEVAPWESQIGYTDGMVLVGSCFTENIGQRLEHLKFQTVINPFGILYNPHSIAHSLQAVMDQKTYEESDLIYHNEKWQSFDHHGRFSAANSADCLKKINEAIELAHTALLKAQFLFITVGTAWVYAEKETQHIVGNCHKFPGSRFEKKLLGTDEITAILRNTISELLQFNPDLQVCFTVSPIRHWKNGAINNQRSKANLLSAVHELVDQNDCCCYFPAYEIMMDDLRSYRYYESDLLHPNEMAQQYIWEKFKGAYLHPDTFELMQRMQKLKDAQGHRPFDAESNSFQRFIKRHLQEIDDLKETYPFLELSQEETHFRQMLLGR